MRNMRNVWEHLGTRMCEKDLTSQSLWKGLKVGKRESSISKEFGVFLCTPEAHKNDDV